MNLDIEWILLEKSKYMKTACKGCLLAVVVREQNGKGREKILFEAMLRTSGGLNLNEEADEAGKMTQEILGLRVVTGAKRQEECSRSGSYLVGDLLHLLIW
ncbi:hypothetical protein Tco_0809263 [Tanacetum coccineum]